MRENEIERYFRRRVEAIGGLCLKFESPGESGVPDRLIMLHSGRAAFAELKAPGKRERALQEWQQARFRALGFRVYSAVDSMDRAAEVVEDLVRWEAEQDGRV